MSALMTSAWVVGIPWEAYYRAPRRRDGRRDGGRTGDAAGQLRAYLELIICDCVDQPGRRGCLMLDSIALVDRIPELRPVIDRTTRELQSALTHAAVRHLDLQAS